MVKMKIENEDLWQKIKAGELKGLSIEGYFTNKFEQMQKTKPTTEQILSALNQLVKESKTELKTEKIELGLVEDAKKITDVQLNRLSLIKKNGDEMLKLAKIIEKQGSDATTDFKKGVSVSKRIEEAAKNLGFKPNTIPGYKDLEKAEDLFYTYRKRYNF